MKTDCWLIYGTKNDQKMEIGCRFIYDDPANRPFSFKRDSETNKSFYEVEEVLSWCLFDIIDLQVDFLTSSGWLRDEPLTIANLDESLTKHCDIGQQGDDFMYLSFEPEPLQQWASSWILKLQFCGEQELKDILPRSYSCSEKVLRDLARIEDQAKCAAQHKIRLGIHYSIDSLYMGNLSAKQ